MYGITHLRLDSLTMLIVQLSVGTLIFLIVNELLKLNEYMEVRAKIISTLKKIIP